MNVWANGATNDVEPGSTVEDLLRRLELDPRFVIAELNGEPVERARFARLRLRDGDRLVLVRAVAGG